MTESDQIKQNRNAYLNRNSCRFVDIAEYQDLIVSCRRLERHDDPRASLRGLFDANANELFVIETEKVMLHG